MQENPAADCGTDIDGQPIGPQREAEARVLVRDILHGLHTLAAKRIITHMSAAGLSLTLRAHLRPAIYIPLEGSNTRPAWTPPTTQNPKT